MHTSREVCVTEASCIQLVDQNAFLCLLQTHESLFASGAALKGVSHLAIGFLKS